MRPATRRLALLAVVSLLTTLAATHAADWPRFRGPNGTGVAADTTIPVRFKEGDGILWKVPLPGVGNSSPVISRGKLFVQSASKDGRERMLLCLDAATGKTLWTRTTPGKPASTHAANTLASSTPAADGERVYTLTWDGTAVALAAHDYAGTPLWTQDLGPFRSQHGNGTSPVVYDGRVYVHYDQDRFDFKTRKEIPGAEYADVVLAFDGKTGRPLWRRERKAHYVSYSAAMMRETAGGKELIVMSTAGVTAYDPASGSVNWNWEWPWEEGEEKFRTVACPVFWNDVVYLHGGNGAGNGRVTAVRAGGPGTEPKLLWDMRKGNFSYVPALIEAGDHLFTVYDKTGLAGCYEAATGKAVWTHSFGGSYKSSPVLINGNIYLINEDGVVHVYPAATTYKQLARNPLGETVRASPAVADGRLYIRGAAHLFCIGTSG
jgi:outer membrane protein assembly factor BamB